MLDDKCYNHGIDTKAGVPYGEQLSERLPREVLLELGLEDRVEVQSVG